jgi:hypothetical protein
VLAENVRASSPPSRRAGEGAQQAVQSACICLTLFGQEADGVYLTSKCIGNAETCSRTKHAASGIRHCHFDEPRIRPTLPMPLLDWVIETPQIQCTHRRRALPSTKFRSVPIAGGNPEKLLFAQDVESVAVASHGNRLAFAQVHHPGNVWQLRLASPIKAEARATKLISSTRGDSGASVSPDSKHIAFQSWRSGNPELWVSDRDGSSPVQLTSFRGPSIGEPRWSPDSRQIVSDLRPSSGKPELYLMNLEGGPPQRFFTGTTRAASPFWSRDGNWIYFDSDQPHAIWKAPVKGGKPIV